MSAKNLYILNYRPTLNVDVRLITDQQLSDVSVDGVNITRVV